MINLEETFTKKAVFVTGKGGAGTSTVTGALGLAGAALGRRVLICEFYDSPLFPRLLQKDHKTGKPFPITDNLAAIRLDPVEELVQFIRDFILLPPVAAKLFGTRVARTLFDNLPPIHQTVLLAKLIQLSKQAGDPRSGTWWDTILVGLPIERDPVSLFKAAEMLTRVVSGRGFTESLGKMDRWIRNPANASVLLVSTPEEPAINHTVEVWHHLRTNGFRPSGVILNRISGGGGKPEIEQLQRQLPGPFLELPFVSRSPAHSQGQSDSQSPPQAHGQPHSPTQPSTIKETIPGILAQHIIAGQTRG